MILRLVSSLSTLCAAAFVTACGARTGLDVPTAPVVPDDAGLSCGAAGLTAYLWDMVGILYTFDPATLGVETLGQVNCPTNAEPWTLSVSRAGVGYMMFTDWNIYRVDLATLDCTQTPYVPGQLGFTDDEALAVSRGQGAERLFVYSNIPVATLAVTDLTDFVLSPVAPRRPRPPARPSTCRGMRSGASTCSPRTAPFSS